MKNSLPAASGIDWRPIWKDMPSVGLIASLAASVAYTAALSYEAWFKIEGLNKLRVAEHTLFLVGALGVAGSFLLHTFR